MIANLPEKQQDYSLTKELYKDLVESLLLKLQSLSEKDDQDCREKSLEVRISLNITH